MGENKKDMIFGINLNDEKRCPRLGDEEIKELFYKALKGDKAAKDRITMSYNCLNMINYFAKKYFNIQDKAKEELQSEAFLVVYEKFESFDPEEGTKFTTYFGSVIENKFREIYRKSKHLTKGELDTIKKVANATQEYRNKYSKEPTEQELAEQMGEKVEKLKGMLIIAEKASSVDTYSIEELEDSQVALSDIDVLDASYDMSSVEKKAVDNEVKRNEAIKNWLDDLTTLNFDTYVDNTTRSLNAREIIENLFGLSGKEKMEPQDLAEELKISEQRLNSIVKEILFEAKENGALKNLGDLMN